MKKLNSVFALLASGVLGAFVGHSSYPVHAQISSPAYVCPTGNGGQNNGYPCAQYLVEVVPQRLGGGVFIYQVQDSAVDITAINAPLVGSGSISGGVSVQAFQPNSTVNTVTISVGAP